MPGEEVQVLLLLLPLSKIEAVRVWAPSPKVQGPRAEPHGQVIVPPTGAPHTGSSSGLSPRAGPNLRQRGIGA